MEYKKEIITDMSNEEYAEQHDAIWETTAQFYDYNATDKDGELGDFTEGFVADTYINE